MKRFILVLAVAVLASADVFLAVLNACAATMTLPGTGFDASGNALGNYGVDANWTVSGSQYGGSAAYVIGPSDADWYGLWCANTASNGWLGSSWINNNNQYNNGGAAPYTYTMSFSLGGFVLDNNLQISGSWGIDDGGQLAVNGHTIASGYDLFNLSGFSLSYAANPTWFNAGTNTISITMTNTDDYLEAVQFQGAVTGDAAPSSTWASAVSGNWSDSTKWKGGVPNAVGAGAVINAPTNSPLIVTLDCPQTIGTLLLGSGNPGVGYTLSGSGSNTLTLNNSGNGAAITVTDGSHVINSPVVLADNLVVTNGGTNAWTLSFGTASSITDNGLGYSLTMNGAGGTLILSGSNTYTGGTTISAGVLTFLNRAAQPVSGMTNVAAGATLALGVGPSANLYGDTDLDALFAGTMPNVSSDPNSNVGIDTTAGNFTYASNIPSTTMGLTKLGANTLTLTGANSYTGPTTVNGGALQLGDGASGHDTSLSTSGITNYTALIYNVFGSQTANYPISGPGTLTKLGPGTLILSGSNTYTGNTFLTGGALAMDTGVPSTSVVMSSNTTLDLSAPGLGVVALGSLADAPGSPTGHQVLLGGNTLDTGLDNTNTTFSGAISDGGNGGSLIKDGAGTFTLAGVNTYSGGTMINSGVLTFLNRAAQPATGTTTVAAGATLGLGVEPSAKFFGSADLDALFAGTMANVSNDPNSNVGIDTTAGNFTYASNIPSTTMGLTKLGANTLTLTGANSYTGLTTISGGTLQLGDGTADHDGSVASSNIVNNAALVYNLNGSQTYSGLISGAGSVTKTGPGTLTLTNLNTYAGPTIINGGMLKLQPVSGANASLVGFWSGNGNASDGTGNNPGTLVNGVSFAPGLNGQQAFSFNGTSYVQAGTQGLPTGNQNRTLDLWFNQTSPIATETFLAGYGTTGDFSETYGLFIANEDSPPNGVAFSQWGEAIVGPMIQNAQWYNLAVTTSGGLSTLYLNGTEVASGSLPISTPGNTPFYIGTIGNAYGSTRKMNGLIQDVAIYNTALSQSEIQALMGSETPNLLPTTTAVTIAANATLDLGGDNQQVASLSDSVAGRGGRVINSASGYTSVLTLSPTGGSTTFSGMIEGGGTLGTISLVMSGSGTQVLAGSLLGPGSLTVNAGTLILSGSDSYTGGTTVNAGTLLVASNTALPDGTSLTVGAGGVLIFDPTQAVSSVAVSPGAVAVPEPSTLASLGVIAIALLSYAWRHRRSSW